MSIDGHLGCFCILGFVNNTVINIGVYVPFLISVFSFYGYVPRSGIAGLYGSSIFSFFKEPTYCAVQWLYQFTFLPTMYKGSLCSMLSLSFVICVLFDDSHPDRCEVTYHVVLIFISLMIRDVEHLFICLLSICMSSLKTCVFSSFADF